MPTVSDILTNFNAGNYHGRLHATTPEECPFYTLAGGFSPGGGEVAFARTFEWQAYDLREASPTKQVVDAADAPDAENRRRFNVYNVLETHTETVGVGFERMAQHQQFNVPGTSALDAQNIGQGANPITSELPWQITQMWKQVKRDQEHSLIRGTYNLPTSNGTAARTRGIIEAIETNAVSAREDAQDTTAAAASNNFTTTAHGYANGDTVYFGGTTAPTGITFDQAYFVVNAADDTFQVSLTSGGAVVTFTTNGTDVTVARGRSLDFFLAEDAMQDAYDAGGLKEGDTRVLMVPSVGKRQLSADYKAQGLEPRSRSVYGVNVMQVDTSFGVANIVMNRHVPDGTALVLSFEQIRLWHRVIPPHDGVPGGITFAYPKARDGNRTETVLYTSVGLEYGNEAAHAKITGLSITRPRAA